MKQIAANRAALVECADLVKRDDPDRFQTLQYVGRDARPALLALYAFNAEIAKTGHVISEPALGEIRLQWWRDELDTLSGEREGGHPVSTALAAFLLPRLGEKVDALHALVDARVTDIYEMQMPDMAALVAYAGATGGAVQRLAASIFASDDPEQGAKAAYNIGVAWALAGILRALPFNLARGWNLLPLDQLPRQATEGLITDANDLVPVIQSVVEQARGRLTKGRALSGTVGKHQLPAMLLAPLADSYLNAISKAGYNPAAVNYDRGALGRYLRLTGRVISGKY